MPRPRMTEQQRREKALELALARTRTELDLPMDKSLAAYVGMTDKNFSYYKSRRFQNLDLQRFANMARRLRMTGKEVCDILGVPYQQEEVS